MAKVVGHGVEGYQIGTPVTLPINVSQIEKIQIILDTLRDEGGPGYEDAVDRYIGPATGLELEGTTVKVAAGVGVDKNGDIIVPEAKIVGIQHPEYYVRKTKK